MVTPAPQLHPTLAAGERALLERFLENGIRIVVKCIKFLKIIDHFSNYQNLLREMAFII